MVEGSTIRENVMERERLFQYAVLWHPTEEERKSGSSTRLVVPPVGWILAKDEAAVSMRAIREIPDEEMESADQLEVIVRPF